MPTNPTAAQIEASRINGARSSGPITLAGRERSSLNSVRHGLRASRLLLRGESAEAYRQNLAEWMDALKPNTQAETTIVEEVAETAWKLRRLSTFERCRVEAHLNERIEESPMIGQITEARFALAALESLDKAVKQTAPPYKAKAVDGLVSAARQLLNSLSKFDQLPASRVAAFEKAIDGVTATAGDLDKDTFQKVSEASRKLIKALKAEIRKFEEQIETLRARLAEDAALLPEKDARMLERVRKNLQESFLRELDMYDGVRKRSAAASEESPGSFVRPVRAPPVRLRVLK